MFIRPLKNLGDRYPQILHEELEKYPNILQLINAFEIGYLSGSNPDIDIASSTRKINTLTTLTNSKLITPQERVNLFQALVNDPSLSFEKALDNKLQSKDNQMEFILKIGTHPRSTVKRSKPVIVKVEKGYPEETKINEKLDGKFIKSPLQTKFDLNEQKMILEQIERAEIERLAKEFEQQSIILRRTKEPDVNCDICFEPLSSKEIFPLDACSHVYHLDCLNDFVKDAVLSKRDLIKCPDSQCSENLTVNDIQSIIAGDELDRFYENKLEMYIAAHENEISYCPTPGCNYAFLHNGEPELRCRKCQGHYCLDCRVQFHVGKTCLEYKQEKVNNTFGKADEEFMQFVKGAKYKQCSACKFWVEKNQGCNHMTCRCKHQFCYVCGAQWKTCRC